MCGRYALELAGTLDSVPFPEESVQLELELPWECYNIAPTTRAPIIDHSRKLKLARWGLVPHWAKEPTKRPLINARSETVATKPSFRKAYHSSRCAVPASAYFEWLTTEDGSKKPYCIKPLVESQFWLAGLSWDWQQLKGEKIISTFTILTQSSEGSETAWLHDRCPVPLSWDDIVPWLNHEIEVEQLGNKELLSQPYPVTDKVNSAKNDSPENLLPIA